MNKLFFFIIVLTIAQGALAQKYFRVPEKKNLIEYKFCHSNQNVIFNQYLNVLDSQIGRLTVGLDFEESTQSPYYKMGAYKKYLLDLIVKRIFVAELKRQFNQYHLNDIFGDGTRPRAALKNGKIFNLDDLKIDINQSIKNVLHDAIIEHKNHTIPRHVLDEFKKELVQELITEFAKSAYRSIGSGLVAKIIAGTLASEIAKGLSRAALMSFGAAVIKGAVKGTILSILTAPLLGGRKPPETIWREIYSKYPELILNPEWMREAGSPDHPWMTHCASLMRQTESLEKALSSILQSEEGDFLRSMAEINEMRDPEEVRREEIYRYQQKPIVRDNTRVKPILTPYQKNPNIPFWALK